MAIFPSRAGALRADRIMLEQGPKISRIRTAMRNGDRVSMSYKARLSPSSSPKGFANSASGQSRTIAASKRGGVGPGANSGVKGSYDGGK